MTYKLVSLLKDQFCCCVKLLKMMSSDDKTEASPRSDFAMLHTESEKTSANNLLIFPI